MKKYVLKKHADTSEDLGGIPQELEQVRIWIHSEGYPEEGTLYYEGTVRKFVIERLPSPVLLEMLPRLLQEPSFTYRLNTETIVITKVDA